MSYVSPHFKIVTLLPCETQKTETGGNSVARNAILTVV